MVVLPHPGMLLDRSSAASPEYLQRWLRRRRSPGMPEPCCGSSTIATLPSASPLCLEVRTPKSPFAPPSPICRVTSGCPPDMMGFLRLWAGFCIKVDSIPIPEPSRARAVIDFSPSPHNSTLIARGAASTPSAGSSVGSLRTANLNMDRRPGLFLFENQRTAARLLQSGQQRADDGGTATKFSA
jgi:hypothetical protein